MAEEKVCVSVRIAELKIDPAHLERFKTSAREQIEAALRTEPGVLAHYAVSVKDYPALVTVFEIYTDEETYRSSLDTPHFNRLIDT